MSKDTSVDMSAKPEEVMLKSADLTEMSNDLLQAATKMQDDSVKLFIEKLETVKATWAKETADGTKDVQETIDNVIGSFDSIVADAQKEYKRAVNTLFDDFTKTFKEVVKVHYANPRVAKRKAVTAISIFRAEIKEKDPSIKEIKDHAAQEKHTKKLFEALTDAEKHEYEVRAQDATYNKTLGIKSRNVVKKKKTAEEKFFLMNKEDADGQISARFPSFKEKTTSHKKADLDILWKELSEAEKKEYEDMPETDLPTPVKDMFKPYMRGQVSKYAKDAFIKELDGKKPKKEAAEAWTEKSKTDKKGIEALIMAAYEEMKKKKVPVEEKKKKTVTRGKITGSRA